MWYNSEILQVLLKWSSLAPSASFSLSVNEDTMGYGKAVL